jgi:hypothetical protein
MAAPLAGLPAQAAPAARQTLPEAGPAAASKQEPSRFDQAMRSSAADQAAAPRAPRAVQPVERTLPAGKLEATARATAFSPRGVEPVARKAEASQVRSLVMNLVDNIEKSQGVLDTLIDQSLKGKSFTNTELIGLQAGMYKYTQELDLCSKVVEKATSGLKDTLKTQV